jgi:hypothetical protein
MNARALWLAIAAVASPVPGMSQAANPTPIVEVPIVLFHIVTQTNEYALRLVDGDNKIVENLPLSDRDSARVCVRAQTKPRKLKVVGVSSRDGQVVAAIVKRELDTHLYDIAIWDRSTPKTVRVVATAKLDLSGTAAADCGKL